MELVQSGNIRQDGDTSFSPEEAGIRTIRYQEILQSIQGSESFEVFKAIVDSIQSPQDYGIYETTHNTLYKFPPNKFAEYFVPLLPGFIKRMAKHDQVGRFLCPLLGVMRDSQLNEFNQALKKLSEEDKKTVQSWFEFASEEWFGGNIDEFHF